jgi:uncharacterized OB-fold protein
MSSYISLPLYAASIDARLRLVAGRSGETGEIVYPPRTVGIATGATDFESVPLSGRGTVYSYTVIARGGAPAEFDDQQTMTGTITVAVIELEEGPRVIGQIADADPGQVEIGTPVQAVVRRLYDQEGIVRYGHKFAPVTA